MTFQRRAPATKANEKQDHWEEQEPIMELPGSQFADEVDQKIQEEVKRSELLSESRLAKARTQT